MSKIGLTLEIAPVHGKQLSFRAPCGSSSTECLVINGAEYTIVDAAHNNLAGIEGIWNADSIVSVILDTSRMEAYIQNADTNAYLECKFAAKVPAPAKSKVGEFIRVKAVDENGNVVETETSAAGPAGEGGGAVSEEQIAAAVEAYMEKNPIEADGTLTHIDFSNFSNGSFTEVVDGEEIPHTVVFDSNGMPTAIDGVTIKWG